MRTDVRHTLCQVEYTGPGSLVCGLVQKLALIVRGIIEVMTKQSMVTRGNMIYSGPGTETDILNYMLIKRGLRELI